jgi:FtsP/CotA-like multicopper oxidase with cupredoxin domain
MLTRRRFAQFGAMASASLALGGMKLASAAPEATVPDITLEIAPYLLEASPKHRFQTVAYNGQVPGPLLRMKQGREITVEVHNKSTDPEIVHWHGLFLPPEIDGAMEEGSPMIAPDASTRLTFTPDPAGFRWFHTHTFAGKDLRKGQYGGQHGFLLVEPSDSSSAPERYDREIFLGLHDWGARDMSSDDGSMSAVYEVSTINGKMLGFGEPVKVKQGERVMMHILNSSPTEVHWVALSGHSFQVVAMDGNPVPHPGTVEMLRLAPAERVSAIVEMNAPGVWVLGEVRKHIQAAGMGIVIEYAGKAGAPKWNQPEHLIWDYAQFAVPSPPDAAASAVAIPLAFDSKFMGHGNPEVWRINGRSYPDTDEPVLQAGQRYRLVMKNLSADDHPIHLHRHTFEVLHVGDGPNVRGLMKDVLLIPAKSTTEVEFTANHPGRTLFHCHQQDHMDRGFMMVFHYA